MAGAANCAKIRLTARKQWFGQADRNFKQSVLMEESAKSWAGIILFNDKTDITLKRGEIYLCLSSYVSLETKLI
jgi:hypothetical protein